MFIIWPYSELLGGLKEEIKFSPTESQAAEDYVNCTLSYSSGIKLTCSFGNANQDITLHRWIVKFERAIVVIENKSKNYTDFYMKIYMKDLS